MVRQPKADQNARAFEPFDSALHRVRFDADRGDVVLGGKLAALFQFAVGERRMKQGVVDHLGQFSAGVFHIGFNNGSANFND